MTPSRCAPLPRAVRADETPLPSRCPRVLMLSPWRLAAVLHCFGPELPDELVAWEPVVIAGLGLLPWYDEEL